MITVAQSTGFHLSEEVVRKYNIDNYNGKFKRFKEKHKKAPTQPAIDYLMNRGISQKVIEKYGITTKGDSEDILVFPFRNDKGELKFIKYRNMNFQKGDKGSKEWCESNCMPILFGMDNVNYSNKRLILTEGQIDSLSVATAGFENAISVPTGVNGFTWVGHCWDWINRFSEIVVFGDYEHGEITLLEDIRKRFKLKIYAVRVEDYKDCKDANEILQKYGVKQIERCVNKAQLIPLPQVKLLSEVEREDPFKKEKLATGLRCIDKQLYGGLTFGGYVLITGKAGEGKSTFANQIICQALNQGHNCFIYSGELTNAFLKNGIDRQLAGREVIKYQDGFWHDEHYAIPEGVQDAISKWYMNRCFIYSDEILEDNLDPLAEVMENVILQYNVKVLLIDNLMTAIDLEQIDNTDKFEKQAAFVKKVVRLARKLNVLVILVAHKRKDDSKEENDTVLGASEIVNLANVIFAFGRDKKVTNQATIRITKERVFGRTNMEGYKVFYDPCSKRIYEQVEDLDFEYSWKETEDNDGFETTTTDEIPF